MAFVVSGVYFKQDLPLREQAREGGLTDTNHLHAKTRHENVADRIVRPLTVRLSLKFVRLAAIFASASHKEASR